MFNLLVSGASTVILAAIIILSPAHINNLIASIITGGILVYSIKWLRAGLRKQKSDRARTAQDRLK